MLHAATRLTNQAIEGFDGDRLVFLFGGAALLAAITLVTYFTRSTLTIRRTLVLLALRLAALALILLLIWRPALAFQDDETLLPSRIFFLLDASASMNVNDEGLQSRWQRAKEMLDSPGVTDMLQRLARDKKLDARFFEGSDEVRPLDAASSPIGKRTDIAEWLHALREKRSDTRLRAVFVLTDGINNGRKSPLVEARTFDGVCPVHVLGFGKSTTSSSHRDFALSDIRVDPSPAPVKSKLAVKGKIDAPGFINVPVKVVLSMEDLATGTMKDVASTKVVLRKEKGNDVLLHCDAPDRPGEVKVGLRLEGVKEHGDTNPSNNEIIDYVAITKGGVSILWVEGVPRHESALAIRQALGKDKRFRVFYAFKPRTDKPAAEVEDFFDLERQHYDVIVIGDISAQRFSGGDARVFDKVKQMVSRGTGLFMMGGFETLLDSDWAASPLNAILPVDLADTKRRVGGRHIEQPFRVEPTELGKSFILRLADKKEDNDKIWDGLGGFEGASRIGPLRPLATPLALAVGGDVKEPIMASMDHGGGRVVVFGADTTHQAWMFDKKGASSLPAYTRFWQQLMLWLAHQELSEGNLIITNITPRRVDADLGQRVDFDVVFRDSKGNPIKDGEVQARVISPTKEAFDVPLSKSGEGEWKGTFFKATQHGEYVIKVTGKGKEGKETLDKTATGRLTAYAKDLESIKTAADPVFCKELAEEGGGEYYPGDETKLVQLLEKIAAEPDAAALGAVDYWPTWKRQPASRAAVDQWAALWSTPNLVIMILFTVLICAEWTLRRKWGMV